MAKMTDESSERISAIRTTGIYCIPGCSARPLEKNRRRFRTAAAAEHAGFRACLRCRPDREPADVVGEGVGGDQASTVEAMLSAIAHRLRHREADTRNNGDTTSSAELAVAFGMDRDQVESLFEASVGARVSTLGRRRQVALARTLLEQTDLSVSVVARGVGFASPAVLRNAATTTFQFSPEELRHHRFAHERRAAASGPPTRLHLAYWKERDVDRLLQYLGSRAIPGVEQVVDGVYQRTVVSRSGQVSWIAVERAESPRPSRFCDHLTLTIGDIAAFESYGEVLELVTRCRHLFGLDVAGAGEVLNGDAIIGPLVDAMPGLRLAGAWDRFETAVRVIVGQQVTVAAASTLAGRIAESFGTAHAGLPAGLRVVFPTPSVLANADLSALGMPKARGRTVVEFAQAVVGGDVDLDAIGTIETVVEPLLAVRGIGPWTAQLIAARVLRHPDAFPPKDLGLARAYEALGGREPVETAADAWRPHRAAAIAYLWSAQ